MEADMSVKKILSLLLAAALLAGAFVGCSDKGSNSTDETTTAVESPENAGAENEPVEEDEADARAKVPDGLPEKDMGGEEFRVLTRARSDFVSDLSFDEEMNGDVVNDAIISRNNAVSERFNIAFGADYDDNAASVIQQCVTAGDDSYDICLTQIILQTAFCYKGGFYDWYTDLPYIDLTKPWYIGNAAEALSVKNHAYVMIGEFDLDVLRFTYCMYYNKDIAATYNLEEVYPVVREGRWTYDTLKGYADMIYTDLDGNGTKDENDLLALSGDPYSAVVTYQYSFNNPLFTLDADGIPQMTFDREKASSIVEKLNALYWESPGSFTQGWGTGGTAWKSGRLLCYTGLFNSAGNYRDLDFDFGIIPYPKYDETQDSYYTMSDGAHGGMMVPITVKNAEDVSIIIEALNAETWKQVVPAYYETSLKVKFSRDVESAEMLDLLMNARVFDFGYMCGDWGLAFVIQDLVSANSNNTESAYKSKEKVAQKTFSKIIDAYLALEEGN
jgi:ABC-type glycerol-3-phosphate transport system substrate-binding protein